MSEMDHSTHQTSGSSTSRLPGQEEARLSSLIESLTAGLFLVDNDGVLTHTNTALSNLLQIDKDKLLREPYTGLFSHLVQNALEPEVTRKALESARLQLVEHPEIEIVLKDPAPRHVEFSFFPIWSQKGLPWGWGALVQDVSQLREQMEWKLDLLSMLAHDIRTPLATLKGNTTALLANYRYWGNEMVREFLEAIDRGIDQLVHQVDRNLALTRVETGRLGLRPEPALPGRMVEQAVERAAGALGNVQVELQASEDLPAVRADAARIEEVLVNLLENAARYTPAGASITIRAEKEKDWVNFSVIDRGVGVPQDKQRLIFEKYNRAQSEGGGTGLGLFISRRIVEAHGGRIWVDSPVPGMERGAAFTFRLPVMPEKVPSRLPEEKFPVLTPDIPVSETRILVIEDQPDVQAFLHKILSEEGYWVEMASDGLTGLDMLQSRRPDLVVLDWILPGMSGLKVCRSIRRLMSIPIIIVTARSDQQNLIAALDAGADDYIIKPFLRDELLARIRALLRRGETWSVEPDVRRLESGDISIDLDIKSVSVRGEPVELTPTEYDLLVYMARHPRQVLTYGQLIEQLWESHEKGTRHGLFVHISRLRKKIEVDPLHPRSIRTRWGKGYIFTPS